MQHEQSPDRAIRDAVVAGHRRRRAQTADRRLWQAALVAAALALATAIAARVLGLSAMLPLSVLGAAAVGLAAWAVAARRGHQPSDADALALDATAGLDGELRSAFWFSGLRDRDEWAAFHVDRAATRVRSVDWAGLYPAPRMPRLWIGTAACVVATVALAMIARPVRVTAVGTSGRVAGAGGGPTLIALPEDLRRKLEDLLKRIERGEVSADAARAAVNELRDRLSRLDPSLDADLAKFAKQTQQGAVVDSKGDEDASALAERAAKAAEAAEGLPEDLRWSLDDLASRLSNAANRPMTAKANPGSPGDSEHERASAAAAASGSMAEALRNGLMVREAAADPGSTQMMMPGAGAAGGDSRPGGGGNKGNGSGSGAILDLEKALRRELVEAASDTQGANVMTEARRKTEQGHATVGFTGAALPATFAPSHAAAPPRVPDARRALLERYFIRR